MWAGYINAVTSAALHSTWYAHRSHLLTYACCGLLWCLPDKHSKQDRRRLTNISHGYCHSHTGLHFTAVQADNPELLEDLRLVLRFNDGYLPQTRDFERAPSQVAVPNGELTWRNIKTYSLYACRPPKQPSGTMLQCGRCTASHRQEQIRLPGLEPHTQRIAGVQRIRLGRQWLKKRIQHKFGPRIRQHRLHGIRLEVHALQRRRRRLLTSR